MAFRRHRSCPPKYDRFASSLARISEAHRNEHEGLLVGAVDVPAGPEKASIQQGSHWPLYEDQGLQGSCLIPFILLHGPFAPQLMKRSDWISLREELSSDHLTWLLSTIASVFWRHANTYTAHAAGSELSDDHGSYVER